VNKVHCKDKRLSSPVRENLGTKAPVQTHAQTKQVFRRALDAHPITKQ